MCIASRIRVYSKEDNIQRALDDLERSGASRLFILFATPFTLPLSVSEAFESCELISIDRQHVRMDVDSTYCGYRMGEWSPRRRTHHEHELINRTGVVFELPLPQVETSEPTIRISDDPETIAMGVRNALNTNSTSIPPSNNPFLAFLAGGFGSLAAAGVLISDISFDRHGTYFSAQFTSMLGLTYYNHSTSFSSQIFTAAQSISSSTLFAAGGTGVVVAASVYFIPWRKLARYMVKAWNHFLSLLASVWEFFKDRWVMFVEFIGCILANTESWSEQIGSAVAISSVGARGF